MNDRGEYGNVYVGADRHDRSGGGRSSRRDSGSRRDGRDRGRDRDHDDRRRRRDRDDHDRDDDRWYRRDPWGWGLPYYAGWYGWPYGYSYGYGGTLNLPAGRVLYPQLDIQPFSSFDPYAAAPAYYFGYY
jgi:hypothetical protein